MSRLQVAREARLLLVLTVANPLPVEGAGFTEAPSFSARVRPHPSTHQGVDQHLRAGRGSAAPRVRVRARPGRRRGWRPYLDEVVQRGLVAHVAVDAAASLQ